MTDIRLPESVVHYRQNEARLRSKLDLLPKMAEALRRLVKDNENRAALRGYDVNWAAIHFAGSVLAEFDQE